MRGTVEAPYGPFRWKSERRETQGVKNRFWLSLLPDPLRNSATDPHDAFSGRSRTHEPHCVWGNTCAAVFLLLKASSLSVAANCTFSSLHPGKTDLEICMLCVSSSRVQTARDCLFVCLFKNKSNNNYFTFFSTGKQSL